jgi:hypothetical protein
MKKTAVGFLLALSLSTMVPPLEAQCAMCRTALISSDEGAAMAEKFNKGILFLLGAPFSVAVGIALAMRRSRRRLRLAEGV